MSRSNAPRRPSNASTSTRSGSSITSHEFRPSPLDAILAEQGLQRYRLEPPSWRAPWDGNEGDDGVGSTEGKIRGKGKAWPVFYPTRDGMDEDQMTESAVKSGYAAKLPIAVSRSLSLSSKRAHPNLRFTPHRRIPSLLMGTFSTISRRKECSRTYRES
jgi:hypothetical protein